MKVRTYYQKQKVLNQQYMAGAVLRYICYLAKEKLPYLLNIPLYMDIVNNVKDDVIVLKMTFLALSFVNVQETVAIYKYAILMCNSFYFSQHFCSFSNFS